MGVDGLVNIRYNKYFAHQVAFGVYCRPSLLLLAMSSKRSPFPYEKMQDRDMGIGALFRSSFLPGYRDPQLHRGQIFPGGPRSIAVIFQDPGALARLLLLLLFTDPMNLALHSAFFDIRHSLHWV